MSEVADRVYKFFSVRYVPPEPGRKTARYAIFNNRSGDLLGVIAWYASWKQFCFFPESLTVWSPGCLADVQDAIKWAEQRRRDAADSAQGFQRHGGSPLTSARKSG